MYVCEFNCIRNLETTDKHAQSFGLLTPDPTPRAPHREHDLSQNLQRDQRASANRSEAQRRRRERERREREQREHELPQQPMVGALIYAFIVWELTGGCKPTVRLRGVLLPTPPSTQDLEAYRRLTRATRVLPVARQPYREPLQRHDLGRMDRACPHCSALHWLLERSTGSESSDAHPIFTMCCNCGDIKLPPTAPPPEQLAYFFIAATPQADKFRQNIRQYNAALAFTSLGVEVDNGVNEGGGGPPTFRIHGEFCHRLGSLLPRHGDRPAYAQLYIYDPREALEHRMQRNATLDPIIMGCLQSLILTHHRWAHIFKHALEVFEESECENISIQPEP